MTSPPPGIHEHLLLNQTRFNLTLPERADIVAVGVLNDAYMKLGNEAMHLTLGNTYAGAQVLTGTLNMTGDLGVVGNTYLTGLATVTGRVTAAQVTMTAPPQPAVAPGYVVGVPLAGGDLGYYDPALIMTASMWVDDGTNLVPDASASQNVWAPAGLSIGPAGEGWFRWTAPDKITANTNIAVRGGAVFFGATDQSWIVIDINGKLTAVTPVGQGFQVQDSAAAPAPLWAAGITAYGWLSTNITGGAGGVSLNAATSASIQFEPTANEHRFYTPGGFAFYRSSDSAKLAGISNVGALQLPISGNLLAGLEFIDANSRISVADTRVMAFDTYNSSFHWRNTVAMTTHTTLDQLGNLRLAGDGTPNTSGTLDVLGGIVRIGSGPQFSIEFNPALTNVAMVGASRMDITAQTIILGSGGAVGQVQGSQFSCNAGWTYAFETMNSAATNVGQGYANLWVDGSAAAGKSNIRALEHDPLAIVTDPALHAVSFDVPLYAPPDQQPGRGDGGRLPLLPILFPPGGGMFFFGDPATTETVTQVGFIADD